MTVKFLLPSEILITLEVLSVRSAIALPSLCHHILRSTWEMIFWYFTHPFSFFNLLPKEINNGVRLAVYIIVLFSFISE